MYYICNECKRVFNVKEEICPQCGGSVVTVAQGIVAHDSKITMINNIQSLGKKRTWELMERMYRNPVTRARVRQLFFVALYELKETWEGVNYE